jgi:HEAT repeat protein
MDNLQEFLDKIKSTDASVRYAAWRSAGPMGAPAVAPLADLMASPEKGVAKAAKEALQAIVHHAGRPDAQAEARAVATELLKVAASTRPRQVRADALHWLGFIGDRRAVSGLAKLLGDAEVREDARLALERIPGKESLRVLRKALQTAPADFKPNLEQSLYNRKLTPAAVGTMRDEG